MNLTFIQVNLKIPEYHLFQKNDLQIFRTSHGHRHADKVLQVALIKFHLHLQICFGNVSPERRLPKELLKLLLRAA